MTSTFQSLQGGCFCGHIRYELTTKPKIKAQCFCRDCQYFYGGGMQAFFMAEQDGFSLLSGEFSTFSHAASSGATVVRHYCKICSTPVFNKIGERPSELAVSIGTLDDPSAIVPRAAIWTESAPDWAHIDPKLHRP